MAKECYVIQVHVRILDGTKNYKEVYQYTHRLRDSDSEYFRKFRTKDSAMNYTRKLIEWIKPLLHRLPGGD